MFKKTILDENSNPNSKITLESELEEKIAIDFERMKFLLSDVKYPDNLSFEKLLEDVVLVKTFIHEASEDTKKSMHDNYKDKILARVSEISSKFTDDPLEVDGSEKFLAALTNIRNAIRYPVEQESTNRFRFC